MSKQIAVRLSAELVAFVDTIVENGDEHPCRGLRESIARYFWPVGDSRDWAGSPKRRRSVRSCARSDVDSGSITRS